jgi:protocatechuate 3,4-dioxygenase beta subunit
LIDELDEPSTMSINRVFTRRQAMRTVGAAGAAYVFAPALTVLGERTAIAAGSCAKLTPELTEGPYWVNTMLRRADVRANSKGGGRQAGVPVDLYINVVDSTDDCRPLNGVAVDIWHANAHGLYSDESSQAAGGGTSGAAGDTIGDDWLRGYQVTGRDHGLRHKAVHGQVSFKTIWPGWYTGRAIHIHVRVRKLSTSGATIAGYTTQIFFSGRDNDHVLTGAAPYNARSPQTDPTTDENDTVLGSAERTTNIVAVRGSIAKGFSTTFNIALDNAEVGAAGSLARPNAVGGGTGPGGPPPGGA